MKRYLIVDDDEINRLMLHDFLSEFAKCDLAENGKEGLNFFEKALAERDPYDLLCIDLMMPEMNGLALIRKIRGIEKTHNGAGDVRTKVFVITSSDSIWDRSDLVLDNLCDEYIVKPFCRGVLLTDLHKNILVDHPLQF